MTFRESIGFLLRYTAWERAQWEAWFREHPDALAAPFGDNADGRITSVGELVRHIFDGEQRFCDRLEGREPSAPSTVSASDVTVVFDRGRRTRATFQRLLDETPDARWDERMTIPLFNKPFEAQRKTMAVQILVHEIRHWAQVAMLLRMAGYKPGIHDFLVSGVFEAAPG